jgi:putative sterol carrier protein
MEPESTVRICKLADENPNGLASMITQFLQQDFADFEYKARSATKIYCTLSMEVDGGIAVTLLFLGDKILVLNGTVARPDLHMKASYMVMTDVMTGKINPVLGIVTGKIRLKRIPRRIFHVLKVMLLLKIDQNVEAKANFLDD